MTEPRGWIGRRMPRPEAARLVEGRGAYTDDIGGGYASVAFLRSPYAHARIAALNLAAARSGPGVIAALSGDDLAAVCKPWQTRLALLSGHTSPPQYALARGEACWQGEAVAAVIAETRAEAEDALELIDVTWEELPAVATPSDAAAPGAPTVHSQMASNLGLEFQIANGDVEVAFAAASVTVEHEFSFGRQTGVTLEPRAIAAAFDRRTRKLTVHQGHQSPFLMQEILAAQLGLAPADVRVIAPDVGGAFGMKLPAYPDEIAVAAIAVLLGRRVRFTADRLESFISDSHAREVTVRGRLAVDAAGALLGMEMSVVAGFGAYPSYPRGSAGESIHSLQMAVAPYRLPAFRGTVRGYFQNKAPSGILRAVGQPIACTVTEQLLEMAGARLNLDPTEIRRRNYHPESAEPIRSATGVELRELSLARCQARLLEMMDYNALRAQQKEALARGVHRGIGLASFVEQTGVGYALYGPQQLRVSAHESCRVSLEPSGRIHCATSITDQGQGTPNALRQILADALGVGPEEIQLVTGDTSNTPQGGGAWASRGTALGGEAARRAGTRLKANLLAVAGSLLQADAHSLRLEKGYVVNAAGLAQISLADLAAKIYFNAHTIPLAEIPPMEIVESYAPRDRPSITANGMLGAHVEVDPELGTVRILRFWAVDDCGTIVNPLLVDEQIRGGIVQGIGSALYEQCLYSREGQIQNGSLIDYLVPMAGEMPDIDVAHVETPTRMTALGARGVGEAGAVAAAATVWSAVNDALRPLAATVAAQPITPEHILDRIALAHNAGFGRKSVS